MPEWSLGRCILLLRQHLWRVERRPYHDEENRQRKKKSWWLIGPFAELILPGWSRKEMKEAKS